MVPEIRLVSRTIGPVLSCPGTNEVRSGSIVRERSPQPFEPVRGFGPLSATESPKFPDSPTYFRTSRRSKPLHERASVGTVQGGRFFSFSFSEHWTSHATQSLRALLLLLRPCQGVHLLAQNRTAVIAAAIVMTAPHHDQPSAFRGSGDDRPSNLRGSGDDHPSSSFNNKPTIRKTPCFTKMVRALCSPCSMVYDLMFVPRPTLIGDDDEQWSASDSIAFGAVVRVPPHSTTHMSIEQGSRRPPRVACALIPAPRAPTRRRCASWSRRR